MSPNRKEGEKSVMGMTREEATKWLKTFKGNTGMAELSQAFDVAIKALEQEPCEDCISREAVEKITWEESSYIDPINALTEVREKVRALPPVTPQPKVGRWIAEINDYGEVMGWHCDKCYEDSGFTTTCKWDFCPNCGAKMEVEENE